MSGSRTLCHATQAGEVVTTSPLISVCITPQIAIPLIIMCVCVYIEGMMGSCWKTLCLAAGTLCHATQAGEVVTTSPLISVCITPQIAIPLIIMCVCVYRGYDG